MRISDWSSDVCSSDLPRFGVGRDEAFDRKQRREQRRRPDHAAAYLRQQHAIGPDREGKQDRDEQEEGDRQACAAVARSEEHTSELQSLMRISYAVFCLKKKTR